MNDLNENPNMTPEEIAEFELVPDEQEWNRMCDRLKKSRGGSYPPDWFFVMNLSGRMHRIMRAWK